MSISQLRPAEGRLALAELEAARGSVRRALQVPAAALSVDELTDGIATVAVLKAQVAALELTLAAEADRRRVAQSLGATGTDAWIARLTGDTRAVAAGGLWLARRLEETYHATLEALADGGINVDQARVIVRAAEQLPDSVTAEHRTAAEAGLVVKAVNGMDARRLRQAGRRMLDVVSAELADRHEALQLEAEDRRAELETWLTLGDNGDGTWSGRFVIPELHGNLLRAALERLTSPRRLARNAAGDVVHDDTMTTGDRLSWTEQLGLGLTELIEHLPTSPDGKQGGFLRNAVTLLVHLDHRRLLDGLASARMDTGTRISVGEARRLACDAGILPAVLGGRSVPLDLGRERRLHSTAQRRALSVLHDTCAAEGCERPFAWCDIHHPHAWSQGGATDLDNGLPLCGWHHRRAHDARYDLTRLASGEVRYRRRT
jgi:hypothetical protein